MVVIDEDSHTPPALGALGIQGMLAPEHLRGTLTIKFNLPIKSQNLYLRRDRIEQINNKSGQKRTAKRQEARRDVPSLAVTTFRNIERKKATVKTRAEMDHQSIRALYI